MKKDNSATGRPKGGPGNTSTPGVSHGVSERSTITVGTKGLGQAVGQGDRPMGMPRSKAPAHNGNKTTWR